MHRLKSSLGNKMKQITSAPDGGKLVPNGKRDGGNGSPTSNCVKDNAQEAETHPMQRREEQSLRKSDPSEEQPSGSSSIILDHTPPPLPRRYTPSNRDEMSGAHPCAESLSTAKSQQVRAQNGHLQEVKAPSAHLTVPTAGQLSRKMTAVETKTAQEELAYDVAAVFEREDELKENLKERDAQIRQLESRVQNLQSLREKSSSKVADLEVQLSKEREQSAELRENWVRSTAALGKARRQDANHKVDDEALQGQYQEFVFNVARWADTYCVDDLKRLHETDLSPFFSVTAAPELYLRHKRTQPLLLKSLLMKMLVDNVLRVGSENGLWWAGRCHRGHRSLSLTLQPAEPHAVPLLLKNGSLQFASIREFSQWKARSAILLSQCVEVSAVNTNIEMLLDEWESLLAPLVIRNNDVWKDLEDIIRKAVELDLELSKSRALFAVHRWSVEELAGMDQALIETPMGFQAARPGMEVELVLAPYLTKTGNADGDAFETMTFLSRWIVVGRENRESMKAARLRLQ